MKLQITGNELSSHLRPLRAAVRQNDEKDYDFIGMAIKEEGDGRKSLLAAVHQPTYDVYMSLNLSGQLPDKEHPDVTVADPIDADAVACGENEYWRFRNTALAAHNRSVGQTRASYMAAGESLNICLDENSTLMLQGWHRHIPLYMPDYKEVMAMADEVTASGIITANLLHPVLTTALRVSRLGGNKSTPKEQAIHLSLEQDSVGVEAMSATAVYKFKTDQTIAPVLAGGHGLHLSISRDAALILSEIMLRSGSEAYWAYVRSEGRLCVWCAPYIMSIVVEELSDCSVRDIHPREFSLGVNRKGLYRGALRVKNAGLKTFFLRFCTTGCTELKTEDKSVDVRLDSRLVTALPEDRLFALPVNAVLALVANAKVDEVIVSFNDDDDALVMECDEGNAGCVAI